jgi:hypothetical protein
MSDIFETRNDHLPPELRAGLQKFVVWSNERLLRTEQHESTPAEPYTNEIALRGILTNQHVWCFSHLHQRDETEFAYYWAARPALVGDNSSDRGRTISVLAMSCLHCTKHGSSFDLSPAIPAFTQGVIQDQSERSYLCCHPFCLPKISQEGDPA